MAVRDPVPPRIVDPLNRVVLDATLARSEVAAKQQGYGPTLSSVNKPHDAPRERPATAGRFSASVHKGRLYVRPLSLASSRASSMGLARGHSSSSIENTTESRKPPSAARP